MPIVVQFPKKKRQIDTPIEHVEPSAFAQQILDELSYISSDKEMINAAFNKIQPFIQILHTDLSVSVEMKEEDQAMIEKVLIPVVQDLQTRIDDLIDEIISERVLREIDVYYALK